MACSVKVIEHSILHNGVSELRTTQLRYWRAIHSEFMTHRVFSRNASSSRAIPVRKVLSQVWNDPAGPIHWGANQTGMQAKAQLIGWRNKAARLLWNLAGKTACVLAWTMMKVGLHKQVANRILEPWQYISVVMTTTELDNFFELRDHEDAQPEIRELAAEMKRALANSIPRPLRPGEWHLPYVTQEERDTLPLVTCIKISVARCARTSYLTHDSKNPSVEQDLELYTRLVGSTPLHASPTEHQGTPTGTASCGFNGNFNSDWVQFRKVLEFSVQHENPLDALFMDLDLDIKLLTDDAYFNKNVIVIENQNEHAENVVAAFFGQQPLPSSSGTY